jgi:methyl-accepting chemotaxis protein
MRFRQRIWLLPIMAAVVVSTGIAINARITVSASSNLDRVEKVQYPLVEALRSLRAEQAAIAGALRQSLSEGDESELQIARDHYSQAQKSLNLVDGLGDSEHALGVQLRGEFDSYYSSALDATRLMLSKGGEDPSKAIEIMQQHNQALLKSLAEKDSEAQADFRGLIVSSASGLNRTLKVSVIAAAATLGCLAIGSWILIGSVFESLGGEPEFAVRVVRRIAGGDFTERLTLRTGGRGSLLHDIASLQQKLGTLISNVRGSARSVDAASSSMDGAVVELSDRTSSQASSIEETANSMEEMTQIVRQNADNARSVNQLAVRAREQAQVGGEVVSRAIAAMSSITSSSMRIKDIIGVIDEIAFQTNLLALNAAVEAARAGEQGRGFAVVAQEVRSLAQRSATAAREIKGLIQASVEQVKEGSGLVNETGKHLHEIVESVARVANIVSDISTASQEQARGLIEINSAVGQVDSMTQRNAAMVEEITLVARDVADQARHLTRVVETFVIDDSVVQSSQAPQPPQAARVTVGDLKQRRNRQVA